MQSDFYDIGCSGDDIGLVDYSPGDVQRQMKEVNDFLSVVNKDVEADVKKTGNKAYLNQWKNDVWIPWVAFYGDFKSWKASSPSMFRDSTYRRAEAYRQLGLRHRENLQKKMMAEVTPVKIPGPVKKPNGGPALEESPNTTFIKKIGSGIPWKWIIGGILVAGGGYLAYKYWPRKEEEVDVRLIPPPMMVNNPPPWVRDPYVWESAKLAVAPHKSQYDNPDAVITHVYKQMGGRIG